MRDGVCHGRRLNTQGDVLRGPYGAFFLDITLSAPRSGRNRDKNLALPAKFSTRGDCHGRVDDTGPWLKWFP